MKDWKERLYEVLYNNGKPFEINAIEEKRLEGFIETLLQEEREKVAREIQLRAAESWEQGIESTGGLVRWIESEYLSKTNDEK